ncbi:MAG: hypothetical protein LRZ85_08565 [Alphaproteobacteria bacterium]|nr:hypothetical protein [Alphaproteobacteria bacterium]
MGKNIDAGNDPIGILASLLFLQSEAKRIDMEVTRASIEQAVRSCFKDISASGNMAGDMFHICELMEKALKADQSSIREFLQLIQFFEQHDEDAVRN